jgi:hypothetical protein
MLFAWAGDVVRFAVLIAALLKIHIWRSVAGRVVADVSVVYYRDRLATVSGHPLPSSAIPSPPPPLPHGCFLAFLAVKRKAL